MPRVGEIVLYRNRRGVDMPAIVTRLTEDEAYVHVHQFPPPGEGIDNHDPDWGVMRHPDAGDFVQTWRPLDADEEKPAAKPKGKDDQGA